MLDWEVAEPRKRKIWGLNPQPKLALAYLRFTRGSTGQRFRRLRNYFRLVCAILPISVPCFMIWRPRRQVVFFLAALCTVLFLSSLIILDLVVFLPLFESLASFARYGVQDTTVLTAESSILGEARERSPPLRQKYRGKSIFSAP